MISIIICSVDPERFRRVCDTYSRAFASETCEVIGIHDAASLSEGFNRGAKASKGELVIFSHDDIEVLNLDFKDRLLGHMAHADLVGVAGSTRITGGAWSLAAPPYVVGQIAHFDPESRRWYVGIWGNPSRRVDGIKAVDGVFMCARRSVVESVPFDERFFNGFHVYDVDFSFRAYLAGFRLAVGCDLCLLHESIGKFDDAWRQYEDLFRLKHRGRLDILSERSFKCGVVSVSSKDELLGIMTPPWWGD